MEYKKLCQEIEREAGRKMQTPLNFKWLSERIFERVHETVSVTTIKFLTTTKMKKLIYLQAIALHHVREQSQCLRAKHYKTG